MKKEYLEIGKIVNTRGLGGELKLECWCDGPEVICGIKKLYLNSGEKLINVESSRIHKNMVLLSIEGVGSLEEANKLKGRVVYAKRDDIPKDDGSYFIQDLLGMSVIDADTGKKYGILKDVFSTGANDVYTVEGLSGKLYYVPVIPDVAVDIDMQKEEILIRPIEGIFNNDD